MTIEILENSISGNSTIINKCECSITFSIGWPGLLHDAANLTWLADANYAQTSSYGADGRMTW